MFGGQSMPTKLWLENLKKTARCERSRLALQEGILVDIKGIRWKGINCILVLRTGASGGCLLTDYESASCVTCEEFLYCLRVYYLLMNTRALSS
jgi:hypothetical protein